MYAFDNDNNSNGKLLKMAVYMLELCHIVNRQTRQIWASSMHKGNKTRLPVTAVVAYPRV